jgi:hypothetical protein
LSLCRWRNGQNNMQQQASSAFMYLLRRTCLFIINYFRFYSNRAPPLFVAFFSIAGAWQQTRSPRTSAPSTLLFASTSQRPRVLPRASRRTWCLATTTLPCPRAATAAAETAMAALRRVWAYGCWAWMAGCARRRAPSSFTRFTGLRRAGCGTATRSWSPPSNTAAEAGPLVQLPYLSPHPLPSTVE